MKLTIHNVEDVHEELVNICITATMLVVFSHETSVPGLMLRPRWEPFISCLSEV